MRSSPLIPAALALALLTLRPATPARAQADAPEAERKKAAQEEQEQLKESREAEAAEEAEKATQDAEAARLEKLGVKPEDLPLEERKKGFFVQFDLFFAEPTGAERTVARVGDVASAAATADDVDAESGADPTNPPPGFDLADAFTVENLRRVGLTYDSVVTPQLELGWRLDDVRGAVSLRYWQMSGDASASASSSRTFATGDPARGDLIVGGIDNQGFENRAGSYASNPDAFARDYGTPRIPADLQLAGADSVTAEGSIEASRLDLTYSRVALPRRRLEMGWRAGLSLASFERSESAVFTWRSFERSRVLANALSLETIESSSKTDAFGPVVGGFVRLGLTENRRWTVRIGAELSALKANHELAFRDAQQLTQDGLPAQPVTVYQDVTNDGAGNLLTSLDADLAIEGRLGQRARVAVGWREIRWEDAYSQEHFPSAANLALMEQSAKDVSFGGPYVRVGFFF